MIVGKVYLADRAVGVGTRRLTSRLREKVTGFGVLSAFNLCYILLDFCRVWLGCGERR